MPPAPSPAPAVAMLGGLPAGPPRKISNEWSPINRMLASKRSSSRRISPKPVRDLPPDLPKPPPSTATSGTQTTSWSSLTSELVAPEKARASALQKELTALKASLREREAGSKAAAAEAEERAALDGRAREAALEDLRRQLAEATAAREGDRRAFEEERARWLADQRDWQEERAALKSEVARIGGMRSELERRNEAIDELRQECRTLQEHSKALTQERDQLLERLEVEQAEMMARVAKLERHSQSRSHSICSSSVS